VIILDTNVLSELMRRDPAPSVLAWMDNYPRNQLGICSITIAEILYGIGSLPRGKRKEKLLATATSMFDDDFAGRIFPFDGPAAVEYANIVLERQRTGKPISMPDAQIASICRFNCFTLATRNIKDFEATGIGLVNPWDV
jgi:toxin FitB